MSARLVSAVSCDAVPRPTLVEALERACAEGGHLWIANGDREPTVLPMPELLERARRAAHALVARGLRRGDRVLLLLPTSAEWLAAFFGTLIAGGVAVPLGPSVAFGGMERYAETVRALARHAEARHLIAGRAAEAWLPLLREGTRIEHLLRPEDLDGPRAQGALPSLCRDDLAVIQYTSGTTGAPKGVTLTHGALTANAWMIGERVGMGPSDVGVSWLPLFHDMGLVGALLTALVWRYPLLLSPVEGFLVHPRRWLQWISAHRATLSVAPNFAYQTAVDRIADRHLAGLDLSSWRCAFDGAEPVRPSTLRGFASRFASLGFDDAALQPVYGMAENALAATFPERGQRWRARACASGNETVSVGTPLAGVEVEITDRDGARLTEAAIGSIRLRSPSLMRGYFRDDEATQAVLRDGALDTGDLGFVRDGELHVTGRAKELIIKRGRNYAPEELEAVALEAGAGRVLRAAAFGCEDDRTGTERVVVVVETQPILAHDRDRLARAIDAALSSIVGIAPDAVLAVPPRTIERTTSGKIRRTALRARYLEGALPIHSGAPGGA